MCITSMDRCTRVAICIIIFLNIGACQGSRDDLDNAAVSNTNTPFFQKQALLQNHEDLLPFPDNGYIAPTDLHKILQKKISVKLKNNSAPIFVGIQGMKDALRNKEGIGNGNLEKFIQWANAKTWGQFGPNHHHYDWWMFPIDRTSYGQGAKYTVYKKDIDELKKDLKFLKDYRLGAMLLIQSWGWNLKHNRLYPQPGPEQHWRNWGVRLGKLAHSLILFEQWDIYDTLRAYFKKLIEKGTKFEDWIYGYLSYTKPAK